MSNSISKLVKALSDNPTSNYTSILNSFNFDESFLEDHLNWSPERYTRNCLFKNDSFELILLCWEKGQSTPVHCHGGEQCWVYLINGELEEVLYRKTSEDFVESFDSHRLMADGQSYINDKIGLHTLENVGCSRAISLHLYAKPIKECSYLDDKSGTFKLKVMNYDTETVFSL